MIRIRTTLTSDTPHLPELAALVGQRVEIVVVPQQEPQPLVYRPPTPEQIAAADAALEFLRNSTYDWDAWKDQRAIDLRFEEEALRKWQQGRHPAEGDS